MRPPRQKAFCLFCERTITLTASGRPVQHKYKRRLVYARAVCDGYRYRALPCPHCQEAARRGDTTCPTCKGTGRIVR
jgi:DnaJ-class molecular chaperone